MTEPHELAEALAALEPGTQKRRQKSVQLWLHKAYQAAALKADEFEDGEDYSLALEDRMAGYLTSRLESQKEVIEARAIGRQAARHGLKRFGVDERHLDATRERIAREGGLTAAHEAELGWLPREERHATPVPD